MHRTPAGRLRFDSPAAREVVSLLAGGHRSIADLQSETGLGDDAILLSIVDSLCASRQAIPCDASDPDNRVELLNASIRESDGAMTLRADPHGTPVRSTMAC